MLGRGRDTLTTAAQIEDEVLWASPTSSTAAGTSWAGGGHAGANSGAPPPIAGNGTTKAYKGLGSPPTSAPRPLQLPEA